MLKKQITRGSFGVYAAVALAAGLICNNASAGSFQGGPTHEANSEGALPDIRSPRWEYKAGGPIISSATESDGVIFFGSDDRKMRALDADSGTEKWVFATGGKIRSTPAVEQGLVVFISYDGIIYALDEKSGKERWRFQTAGERHFEAKGIHGSKPATQTVPDFWDCYQSSASVVDGIAYIGSGDGCMYALNLADGDLAWKFQTGDVVHTSPAVADGIVYFGSWDTYLYALDAKSGAEIWRFKTGDDLEKHNRTGIQSSPTVCEGTVYFGCRDFNFYALDAKSGEEKWKSNLTWVNATPAIWDGKVYYGTSIPSWFIGKDGATGEDVMKLNMPMMVFGSANIVNGVAYFGSFQGSLFAVDLKEGKIIAEFRSPNALDNNGRLFKEDGSWNLSSIFRNDDFDEVYHSVNVLFESGALLASPLIHNGNLYIGSADGSLFAF
ncbi:MAG: PQQ-binding-like beta-propeller repeat protein [Opitutales bacterium]|nr:PQQ-binding-like beta-propeller repeat protein [Opitutales bacterium]